MKKAIVFALLTAALLTFFAGCNTQPEEPTTVRIAALRGPTALGLLQLMDAQEHGRTAGNYSFYLLGSPDQIPPLLARGEVDIAVVPGNLASILYNNPNMDIQALAIVTLGVLHIVDTTGDIHSIADLAGRTIFVSGQGATPEFALNYVLTQNGLVPGVDVFIEFRSEHTELAALLEAGQAEVALLPEPFVSTVLNRVDSLRIALDLREEWDNVQPDYSLIMSVVIGTREFIEENPAALEMLMAEYTNSISFVISNVPEAAELAAQFEIIPNAAIAMQALPRTHITWITGEQMKQNLTGFLNVLYQAAPASIGGQLPDENFFFLY